MTSVTFYAPTLTTVLPSALLFTLAPILLLAFLLLISSRLLRTPTLPFSALLAHLLLALLLLPVLTLSARLWLLHPFHPLLFVIFLSFSSLALAPPLLLYSFSSSIHQLTLFVQTFLTTLAEHVLSPYFGPAVDSVSDAFRNLLDSINITEILASIDLPPAAQDALQRATDSKAVLDSLNITDVLDDVAFPNVLQQALQKGAAAFAAVISNVSVEQLVKDANVSADAYDALASFKVAIADLVTNVDVVDVVKNARIPDAVRDAFGALQSALFELRDTLNLTDVLRNANLSSSTAETLSDLATKLGEGDAEAFISTLGENSTVPAAVEAIRNLLVYMFFNFRYVFIIEVLLVLIAVPLLFAARAVLQELVKWLLTSRYRSFGETPDGQRDTRGWLLSAAFTGLGFAAAEAIPLSIGLGALYGGAMLPGTAAGIMLVHVLAIVPMHAATQIRIAAAAARKDVINIATVSVPAAFFWSSVVHAGVNLWWHYFAVVLTVASAGWPVIATRLLVVDIGVFVFIISWAYRICVNVIEEEKRIERERHEKED